MRSACEVKRHRARPVLGWGPPGKPPGCCQLLFVRSCCGCGCCLCCRCCCRCCFCCSCRSCCSLCSCCTCCSRRYVVLVVLLLLLCVLFFWFYVSAVMPPCGLIFRSFALFGISLGAEALIGGGPCRGPVASQPAVTCTAVSALIGDEARRVCGIGSEGRDKWPQQVKRCGAPPLSDSSASPRDRG